MDHERMPSQTGGVGEVWAWTDASAAARTEALNVAKRATERPPGCRKVLLLHGIYWNFKGIWMDLVEFNGIL